MGEGQDGDKEYEEQDGIYKSEKYIVYFNI